MTEQSQDLVRQAHLKVLAAQADARWAAKPSLIDMPDGASGRQRGHVVPALRAGDPGGYRQEERPDMMAVKEGIIAEGEVGNNVEGSQTEEHVNQMQSPDRKRHSFARGERAHQAIKENKEDPWKKARGGPSEEWQPEAWDPSLLAARR